MPRLISKQMRNDFRTYQLAVEFYRLAASLQMPRHLKEQFSRASSSVALNLAEGSGRSSKAEQKHFFTIAMGSLRECQAILDLNTAPATEAVALADKLAAHLYQLIKYLAKIV